MFTPTPNPIPKGEDPLTKSEVDTLVATSVYDPKDVIEAYVNYLEVMEDIPDVLADSEDAIEITAASLIENAISTELDGIEVALAASAEKLGLDLYLCRVTTQIFDGPEKEYEILVQTTAYYLLDTPQEVVGLIRSYPAVTVTDYAGNLELYGERHDPDGMGGSDILVEVRLTSEDSLIVTPDDLDDGRVLFRSTWDRCSSVPNLLNKALES